MQKAFKAHAKALGVDPKELLAFYRGEGPAPQNLARSTEQPLPSSEGSSGFICPVCDREFGSDRGRTVHMKTHE